MCARRGVLPPHAGPEDWPKVLDEVTRAFALIPVTQLLDWRTSSHTGAAPVATGPRLPSLPHDHADARFSTPLLFGDVLRERSVHNAACAPPSPACAQALRPLLSSSWHAPLYMRARRPVVVLRGSVNHACRSRREASPQRWGSPVRAARSPSPFARSPTGAFSQHLDFKVLGGAAVAARAPGLAAWLPALPPFAVLSPAAAPAVAGYRAALGGALCGLQCAWKPAPATAVTVHSCLRVLRVLAKPRSRYGLPVQRNSAPPRPQACAPRPPRSRTSRESSTTPICGRSSATACARSCRGGRSTWALSPRWCGAAHLRPRPHARRAPHPPVCLVSLAPLCCVFFVCGS